MLRFTIIITLLFCLTRCSNPGNKSDTIDKYAQSLKTDKDLQVNHEIQQKASIETCLFDNPDTSLSNIKLRDAESTTAVLKIKRLQGDSTYHFYTKNKKEDLAVTVHPGDYYSQVSIFQVKYTNNSDNNAKSLMIDHFTTEKGIKLGLTKEEVISKLGNCYTTSDSTKNSIEIDYRIEGFQDSKTKLLERQNMPIYYATYEFWNNRLINFEFGFEYP